MIEINNREIVGLYLLLRANEMELDDTLQILRGKIEKILYASLSVEQIEKLSEYYREKANIFRIGE